MPNPISALTLTTVMALVSAHIQPSIRYGSVPSRGVNLGGWLVSEHWMSSSSVIWQDVPDDIAN